VPRCEVFFCVRSLWVRGGGNTEANTGVCQACRYFLFALSWGIKKMDICFYCRFLEKCWEFGLTEVDNIACEKFEEESSKA